METPREVPDDLWKELDPLLPAAPSQAKGGRQRANDRTLLNGLLYVLWTGCPWRALPRLVFGPWQTVYDRFAEWKRAGVFEAIWARCLHLYDGKQGIEWQWQSADGTMVRAPAGGKRRRAQPHGPRKTGLYRAFTRRWARGAVEYGDHGRQCQRRPDVVAAAQCAAHCAPRAGSRAPAAFVFGRRV